mmetsp:Transcript_7163/g.9348  ORF Transcript_7163/g.9348 Transcript_7163/m.9348 type:complete len:102 (+) Transcript_7163:102-407(+)
MVWLLEACAVASFQFSENFSSAGVSLFKVSFFIAVGCATKARLATSASLAVAVVGMGKKCTAPGVGHTGFNPGDADFPLAAETLAHSLGILAEGLPSRLQP